MKVTKRTRTITIETRERTVVRRSGRRTVWCEFCSDFVAMTPAKQAAGHMGVSQRELFRLLEDGNLHFFETEAGEVFVCSNPRPMKGDKHL